MSDVPEKVRFSYVIPDGFEPKYANGAYGGVTPRGDLVVSFYQERAAAPKIEIHALSKDGTLGPIEAKPQPIADLERHVVGGVILNEQTVRELHVWLTQKLEEMRLQRDLQASIESRPSH